MAKYFLGFDGGGTKTTAALANEDGRVICTITGGSINYYSEGLEQARINLDDLIKNIKKGSGVTNIHSIFIGSSALYKEASPDELKDFTAGICNSSYVHMDSDLSIALEAMMQEGECAVAISGTGSMIAGRKKDGSIFSKGGYGYILGDEGSGYRIGLTGIQKAITAFDGATKKTTLIQSLQKKYKVEDLHDLIDIFYNPPIERKEIADFAKNVLACAKLGDIVSISIVENAGAELAATAAALLREYDKAVPLGVFGGIFVHHQIFYDAFCKRLQEFIPNASVCHLPTTPVRGAILAAMRKAGIKITDEIKQNIIKEEMCNTLKKGCKI